MPAGGPTKIADISTSIVQVAIPGSKVVWREHDRNDHEIYMATVAGADTDGDGVAHGEDNCIDKYNPNQCDFNQDGYGNRCDCDFSQSGVCGGLDFIILSAASGKVYPEEGYDEQVDMDANGVVGGGDFILLSQQWGQAMEGKRLAIISPDHAAKGHLGPL